MTSHTGSARRILGIWRKLVELRLASGEDVSLSLARGDLCGGCHTCWWDRWKSQNRKIVPLSPYVEEPLNSKVIKGFVTELRSRYVFFEFRDSYVLSLWTFDVRFTHSHIMAMAHNYCTTNAIRNTNSLVQDLNSSPFPKNVTITLRTPPCIFVYVIINIDYLFAFFLYLLFLNGHPFEYWTDSLNLVWL